MLCPEVWNFSPPAYNFKFSCGNWKSSNEIFNIVKKQHFNHSISIVLPDTLLVPENLVKSLSECCDYYKVDNFPLTALLDEKFLNSFIKSGNLTALSIGTRIDCDNCLAITSSGHVILSLLKECYEELGLEGKPSSYCRKKGMSTRYLVTIALKDLDPKSKKYERINFAFARFQSKNTFNVVLAWNPINGNEELDQSAFAAFLKKQGMCISKCSPKFKQKRDSNIKVPIVKWEKQDEGCDPIEVFEWLGTFSLGVNLDGEDDNFVNSYQLPENTVLCGQTAHLQWTGFYTTQQIAEFLENLKMYISIRKFPWAAFHVSGFEDAPISTALTEHRWYGSLGDMSYTFIFHPTGKYIVYTFSASQKFLKH